MRERLATTGRLQANVELASPTSGLELAATDES